MSKPLNDIEDFSKRNSLSMKEIAAKRLVELREKGSYTNQTRTKSQRVVAVNTLSELVAQLPEVKTEADVEAAADFLVEVFNSPRSKAFYCDCVRQIKDTAFLRRAIESAFDPKVERPAAYFGRICTNRLVKLGVYR